MDESRKQFEKFFSKHCTDMTRANNGMNYSDPSLDVCWISWQASRQSQSVVAYLTHQGSAVSPDDFEGGEAEMHETAKREEWVPLVKKGD